jgi:AsmA protein
MKALKLLFKIIAALLIVLIIAVVIFTATFDVNNYKTEITEQVEKATGRTFSIDGDINLSFFPWIGFKIEDVTLGNAEGFKAENFAAIQQLDIKVHLLPLLKKEVEVKTLALHGLNLSLEIAKDESNNWSSLSQSDEEGAAEVDNKVEDDDQSEASAAPMSFLKIKGFEFTDAVIHYDDLSTNTIATLSALNLETGKIQFDEPTDIDFSARVESNKPVIDTQLNATTKLTFNKDLNKFKLRDFVFSILAKKSEFFPQQEKIEMKASVDVLMDDQLVTLKQVELNALGITTVANITVAQFLETPLIQGNIEVKSFDANDVAKRMAIELPEMSGSDALQNVSLKTKLKMQGEKVEANDFSLSFDGNTLNGWLRVLNLTKQQIRYDLSLDQINVNDYLAADDGAAGGASSAEGNGSAAAASAASGNEKIVLPEEMLRKLDIEGDLKIAKVTAKNYAITQLLMSTQASKGLIRIKPLTMEMLGGKINTAVTVNVKNTVPSYAFNLNVNQIQVGPVANPILKDAMGDKPAEVDGAVDMKIDIQTSGGTINQLKKASKGPITFDMKNTRVNNFDPEFYMRSSLANYFDTKGLGLSKKIMGSYKPRDVTVFDSIHGLFNMAQGKVQINKFLMDSDRVQVGAEGSVDIVQNSMDVLSSVELPKEKAKAGSAASTSPVQTLREALYVRVKGPFEALEYKLDTGRLKKSISNALKNEAKAKLEAEKQKAKAKVKAKVDAEKARAKEKAKKKIDEQKDKLKNKLKDKFKGLF